MIFASGNFFDGNWKNDKQEGQGKYFFEKNASVLEGVWVDGVCVAGNFQVPEKS